MSRIKDYRKVLYIKSGGGTIKEFGREKAL